MLGTRALGPANFGLGAVALSAMVVLLLSLAGDPPQATIVARGLDTALGGILALAAYVTWPTWERRQLPAVLADLLEAYRQYFHAVLAGYLDPNGASPEALAASRRRARLARTNALASLSRLRAEPTRSRTLLERADRLLASSHRFVRAVMALEAALYHAPDPRLRAPESLRSFAEDTDAILGAAVDRVRGQSDAPALGALPDLRADERRLAEALAASRGTGQASAVLAAQADRIANSIVTIAQVLATAESAAQPAVERPKR